MLNNINFKKIQLILTIIILIFGVVFLVFAVFFNRSTLEINAAAPFSLNINGLRTENCADSPCSMVIAPGKYSISLSKEGHNIIYDQIELKLGGSTSKSYQFEKQTQLQLIGAWEAPANFLASNFLRFNLPVKGKIWTYLGNLFSNSTYLNFIVNSSGTRLLADDGQNISAYNLEDSQQSPQKLNLKTTSALAFAGNEKVVYLENSSSDNLPVVSVLDLGKASSSPEFITSFARQISKAQIIPQVDLSKIALIDQSYPNNTGVYIIDNQKHSRQIVYQGAAVQDLKWLSNNTFLLQKRNPVNFSNEIYFADLKNTGLQLLPFQQGLEAIYPLSDHQLLVAESLNSVANSNDPSQPVSGFFLEKYDLTLTPDNNTARLYTVSDLPLPDKINYDAQQKIIYFLSANNQYSLNLEVK